MQSNIGVVDRYIRLASGLVAFGAALGMRRGSALAKAALFSFGAMKIAEGVTGFCPLLYAAGVKSLPQPQSSQGRGESAETQAGDQEGAGWNAASPMATADEHGDAATDDDQGGRSRSSGAGSNARGRRTDSAEDADSDRSGKAAGSRKASGERSASGSASNRSHGGSAKSIERVLIAAAEDLKAAADGVSTESSGRSRRTAAADDEDEAPARAH